MGSGVSHLVGCFIRPRDGSSDGGVGLQFSEPLDEGLGHSFCYVRPPPLGSPSLISPEKSDEFPLANGKNPPVIVGTDDAFGDAGDLSSSQKEEKAILCPEKSKAATERLKLQSDKTKIVFIDKPKNVSETCFKSISGASVSANTATPRSMLSCEQFNSFSNALYDRAAAFASTSSFSALPLQPVPRGFSGPLSGPLDRGFASGPIERGFMSGPLERGFLSGPLERGYMSGPLDPVDRSHFSAPLNGPYHYSSSYFRKRKKSLFRFMRSMSGPMKKALARTASSLARTQRSIVAPVKSYVFRENRETKDSGDKEALKPTGKSDDSLDNVCSSSELDLREGDNLQWAQGKAGEDRVHVVLSEEHGWLFVGIYDGFNGPDAPDFLMSNLYPAVSQELKGLLWDTKEECTSSTEADCEWEVVGERQADGGERIAAEESTEQSKESSHRVGGRRQGVGVVKVGQNRRWNRKGLVRSCEKVTNHRERHTLEEIPDLRVGGTLQECEGACASEIQSGLCEACSLEPGVSHSEGADSLLGGERTLSSRGDEAASPLSTFDSRGKSEKRLAMEQEGKLAEDRTSADDEAQGDLSSEQLESVSQGPSCARDLSLNRRRPSTGFKLRHGHERRKEQLRKYFKWRYDWDQEREGAVHKVHNAKVGQEPDIVADEKVTDHSAILKALARALQNTENAYLDMADNALYENPELALMGSCVLVMVMKDEEVYILNVGDSRAVLAQHPSAEAAIGKAGRSGTHGSDSGLRDSLCHVELERIIEETPMELEACESAHENGRVGGPPPCCGASLLGALQLTTDHSTSILEEVLRIKSEHADDDTIHNDRVKGRLKVTRAFGAGFLKQPKWNNALLEMFRVDFIGTAPYITCTPALYHHRLGPQDQFLVLSSDGLYQYLSNEEVVSHVEWFMEKFPDGDPAQHLIEELLFRAAKKAGMDFHELLDIPQGDRRKYHDDVSVIVISLEGRIWRSSG